MAKRNLFEVQQEHTEVEEYMRGRTPMTVSGLYEAKGRAGMPTMTWRHEATGRTMERKEALPEGMLAAMEALEIEAHRPSPYEKEELRLDVDGRYPQMAASGTLYRSLANQVHWIADLRATGPDMWTGSIWYKDGDTASFPYTQVDIRAVRSRYAHQRGAIVTFSGGGLANRTRRFSYKSTYARTVEFEVDAAQGTKPVTAIDTCAHPNRPETLACETLTIRDVFRRAGFDVRMSGGETVVPLAGAGAEARWSDRELHDAMQTYWSRFGNRAQWSMWVFFASLHEQGESLGGIMFDDIGPNHRQGTAIFNDSFIAEAPAGDPNPEAWAQRMRFWTACHEMGHAFNLAHSWQKSLTVGGLGPWLPLSDDPEARSFMNYPDNVTGGQAAFFADFEYRFSDSELLFMRHAPARFVQMGNADWFDHHGFRQANVLPDSALRLELRVNRERPIFEFLELPILELKLTNVSRQPVIVDEAVLSSAEHMTVIMKRDGRLARQFVPYAQYFWNRGKRVLNPGESIYESRFICAGRNGWDMAEPGNYTVQICLHLDGEDIVSNPLRLRVAPPRNYEEEYLAQDFFTEDVGRILTFDGSRCLERGNETLREIIGKLPEHRVAIHARIALANALADDYKQLDLREGVEPQPAHMRGGTIKMIRAEVEEARGLYTEALCKDMHLAAETLGHIDYTYYVERLSGWLEERGDSKLAAEVADKLCQVLRQRKVLDSVIRDVAKRCEEYRKVHFIKHKPKAA
ncbi:MAG TPA: hypothetical protein VNN09_15940 [Candidatus Competibacteraceae bacterium]|nr:hypothetical protein [Candidatus Competibacteraceae bacterium]